MRTIGSDIAHDYAHHSCVDACAAVIDEAINTYAEEIGVMTPEELNNICTKLYGNRWQADFARDIARERETINRWARGRSPIPKAVERWLEREQQRTKGSYDK